MAHDGTEGLSPDGWLPDRVVVGLLEAAFPAELVDRVIEATDRRELRRRRLPARLVVYFVLALWLFRSRNCGYGQVLAKLMDGLGHSRRGADLDERPPPNVSSLARARAKLGPDPLRLLFEQLAGPVGSAGEPGVYWAGLRLVSVDCSVAELPATPENNAFFGWGCPDPPRGAFPQLRWAVVAESGTGALVGAALGSARTTAPSLVAGLLPAFQPGLLVLADASALDPALARVILSAGAHLCWRTRRSGAWRPVRRLADGTYQAELVPGGPGEATSVAVRAIQAPGTGWLLTDLLDVVRYPARDLAAAYRSRWRCEAVIGHYRTDMGEGQPLLRSKDPAGAVQEMWALFAVCQALTRFTRPPAAAAAQHDRPLAASFAGGA
jgi:hypothetical protein